MNNVDLQIELKRNESDKQLTKTELDVLRNKWVNYLIENKDDVCSTLHPVVVKKKTKAKFVDFINKLKKIFGISQRKENIDGIEAYLQYRDKLE